MRRNATNIGSKGRWELELKYWWTSASICIFLLWFCVGVLGRLKSIRGGVATWQRIEPHGPPVTNFRGKTEKVFLGQLIPWDCVSEIRNQKVTFFLGGGLHLTVLSAYSSSSSELASGGLSGLYGVLGMNLVGLLQGKCLTYYPISLILDVF